MNNPNVLIIADKEDVRFLDTQRRSKHWNIFWKVVDYNKLAEKIGELQDLVAEHSIDFVLYSRNDQVAKKISIGPIHKGLKLGYSSLSGIDDKFRVEQMVVCFGDFLKIGVNLNFDLLKLEAVLNHKVEKGEGTFSLIFDTEQLGGVRFGLPRVLNILNKYGIKATFFVTKLMKRVYPNILEIISSQGHEIGIHGKFHEFLSNYDQEKQRTEIKEMLDDFGNYLIYGANFMGRMDDDSISALITNEIRYFVHPLLYSYALFGFLKLPTSPFKFIRNGRKIWMIPVSVETYGRPWIITKGMLDSTISETLKNEFKHITILLHPFRDGNLRHINILEKMLSYLLHKKNMRWARLCDLLDKPYFRQVNSTVLSSFEDLSYAIQKRRFLFPRSSQDVCYAPVIFMLTFISLIMRNRTVF